MRKLSSLFYALFCVVVTSYAQEQPVIDFEKYDPPSSLVVPEHKLTRAKFPFIDVHNHQNGLASGNLKDLLQDMDALNMKVMVNLSGGNGSRLKAQVDNIKSKAPSRFIVFANIDFDGIGEDGWTEKAVLQLKEDVKNGANGLKVFKNLGLSVNDNKGKRVAIDDPRLDAIWDQCGRMKIPVLIHAADPKQFWQPADYNNERWLELITHPGRKRSNTNPAPWEQIIEEEHRMFRKHPGTTFINAHFGWYASNLSQLAQLMDQIPNMYVEFGAVIAELGRQPKMARQFFEKYQDRILFGKDSWQPDEYTTYFRVLETADEYFPYHKKYHAFWRMYGMQLPDEILKKVYYKNALRIIPGIDKSQFE
ncbi:Predicted metal-dependent hydrolase, TIM-barrel fold [Chitinophaga sp. YR573]|uniref:amidohydrolase family protein n=1 Tax=Chitinophaga sp. YR573 TaxID=1881040 RepID=UPI0008AC433D|nr:amidohydrolase family protein [Chitinophaga sp. YR573]SEW25013.1 Predicted metal-dependent hydrolase, TIM-barrel fold [Chitinophaga sp. YR573]